MITEISFAGLPPETPNWQPSAFIPIQGTAIDQYRMFDIRHSNLKDICTGVTDIDAANAISKIGEGNLSSHKDLEFAEIALQAILLHDFTPVIYASPKIFDPTEDFLSYHTNQPQERTQFSRDLFSSLGSTEWIVCPEYAEVDEGIIAKSRLPKSEIVGQKYTPLVGPNKKENQQLEYMNPQVAEAVNVCVEMLGVPAYIANPAVSKQRSGSGFAKHFYSRLNLSWTSVTKDQIPLNSQIRLPPLLAIVLDRLDNRQNLIPTLKALKDELRDTRNELMEFNGIIDASISQAEVERRTARITASFDAIVPYSRFSDAERRFRMIASIQRVVRPIVKFAAGFVMSTGASYDELRAAGAGTFESLQETSAIINRTITATTFANLLRETESLQSLIKFHFSPAEIRAIDASMRNGA